MSHGLRLAALTMAVALATTAMAETATTKPTTQPADKGDKAKPKVEVLSDGNVGEVTAGEVVKYTFQLRNVGEGALEITKVSATCGCTVISTYDRRIEPGAIGEIPVSLKTMNLRNKIYKTVTVESNDPEMPSRQLRITGTIFEPISANPRSGLRLTQFKADQEISGTVALTNNTDQPLKLELLEVTTDGVTATLEEVEPGKMFKVSVETAKSAKTGRTSGFVVFKTNLPKLPQYRLPVSVQVRPRVSLVPPEIKIPSPMKRAGRRIAILINQGETPVNVREAKTTDDALSVKVDPQQEGKRYRLTITIPAGYEVPADGKLVVTTDDEEFDTFEIPIVATKPYERPEDLGRPTTRPAATGTPMPKPVPAQKQTQ